MLTLGDPSHLEAEASRRRTWAEHGAREETRLAKALMAARVRWAPKLEGRLDLGNTDHALALRRWHEEIRLAECDQAEALARFETGQPWLIEYEVLETRHRTVIARDRFEAEATFLEEADEAIEEVLSVRPLTLKTES